MADKDVAIYSELEDKSVFGKLASVNVNEHVEQKNTGKANLSYLSWTWAWAEIKKRCPNVQYEIKFFDGKPYVYDEDTGYMCFTSVTIDGVTHDMWLPVMDSHNDAMLNHSYKVKTSKGFEYEVPKATMFDINKTIMRCLTKNFAMFGLGLYIYAGEDLPEDEVIANAEAENHLNELLVQVTKVLQDENNGFNEKQISYANWCIQHKDVKGLETIMGKIAEKEIA